MSNINKIQSIVESCAKENPCELEVCYHRPMAEVSTFRAGGPADCWLRPGGEGFPAFAGALIAAARAAGVPVFALGGGANILAADSGIRGIVIDMGGWTGEAGQERQEGILRLRAGTSLDGAAEIAANAGLCGIEFLAGMPGSIGGAVWMNARCYGQEIADVLVATEVIEFSGTGKRYAQLVADRAEFGYKKSPFQGRDMLILSASFRLTPGKTPDIRATMDAHRADREAKGHYRYPSAGSVFKNNPNFGKPTGKIIDELGLCGLQKGGAQVAPWHGNIIVNAGGATASDIRALVDEVAARVKAASGLTLEPEILFIGDW